MNVYLAGPITGLEYDEAEDWRRDAVLFLRAYGINAYSPLRAKEFLKEHGNIDGTLTTETVFGTSKGICTRDRWDVGRADIVLMNLLGAERVSVGTMVELGWATADGTPVVLVMEDEGNVHEHIFVRELPGFRVSSIEEAYNVILQMRGTPNPHAGVIA